MDRVKAIFARDTDEYAPLTEDNSSGTLDGSTYEAFIDDDDGGPPPFSWLEYAIFALIGMAMLWAWNMFLAAAPYFQTRFQSDPWILANSQSAILTVSTTTNLLTMVVLTNIQSSANYPFRINAALVLNALVFVLLALSTTFFLSVSGPVYLAFVLVEVCLTALAAGFMQNGAFAFAASFGRTEYTQAIMAGQGVAGILPPITQVLSFLALSPDGSSSSTKARQDGDPAESSNSAFIYFLTAVVISAVTLVAFVPLVRRHNRLVERRMADQLAESVTSIEEAERAARRFVSIPALLRKLHWIAASVMLCFAVTMFFPVFTSKILSVRDPAESGRLFAPGAFIPLGFLFWNLGDLAGRVGTMFPFSLRHRPVALFAIAVARVLFLPLYLVCNVGGRGAAVNSDLFYLLLVQVPFGLTNGWLGSSAMMAAGEWVDDAEREAAGGFMGMCLVAGLTVGSMLSFSVAGL